jgi:hypothetical protein
VAARSPETSEVVAQSAAASTAEAEVSREEAEVSMAVVEAVVIANLI